MTTIQEGTKQWQDFKKHLRNEGLTQLRMDKLLQMFTTTTRGLKKPLEKATREDIERFVDDLHEDRFLQQDGDPYSGCSKSDLKKFLKQYYKWLRGDNEFYPPEVRWIKTRIGKDEKPQQKPVINKDEALKLASRFTKTKYRILTLLLFDSGFRISELMSVRKRDITFDTYDDGGNRCFWISCQVSKTIPRTVAVPLFTKELNEYFNSTAHTSLGEDDLLFDVSYISYNKMLKRYSLELFNKKISPHALRHSSATLYARLLDGNMNMIADRYGWSLASPELKTYIRSSGAYQKSTARKVYSNETSILKEKLVQQQEKIDRIERLLSRIANKDEFLKELEEIPDE